MARQKVTEEKHTEEKGMQEQLGGAGSQIVGTVRKVLHEGTVRRVIIRNKMDRVVLDIPLTAGVVGTVLAPGFVAFGAFAAIASGMSIIVERPEARGTNGASEQHAA